MLILNNVSKTWEWVVRYHVKWASVPKTAMAEREVRFAERKWKAGRRISLYRKGEREHETNIFECLTRGLGSRERRVFSRE